MLCGTPIADVEARLSEALTASLRVPATDRPLFIAGYLQGNQSSSPQSVLEEPSDLDAEIAEISSLLKAAVNSACCRNEEPFTSIAAYIIRQHSMKDDDLPIDEAAVDPEPISAEATGTPEKQQPRSLNDLKDAVGLSNHAAPRAKSAPVLGTSASNVLPAVIGAFQDEAARKAAKVVDQSIIDAAIRAGAATQDE
jgi:hypothetical protein